MSHRPQNPPITMPDLVDYILRLRSSGVPSPVVLAFCFSDELAIRACLSACREVRSIPVIMATINQVNSDGGYSGLTSAEFVDQIHAMAHEAGYQGPIIFGRDHGGPYVVAAQNTTPRTEAMKWVKHNITLDLKAGFTCWHADGTSGRDDEKQGGQLPLELIAATTLEMIQFCESERTRLGIPPISYEIGSEEQQGGLTSPQTLDRFLKLITAGVFQKKLPQARIDFVVAQTGTHMKLSRRNPFENYMLFQNGIKPELVKKLDHVAEKYRADQIKLLFTQHYSDQISADDVASLLVLGVGKANFGPEMTMPELKMLLTWEKQEREVLAEQDGLGQASGFRQAIMRELDNHPELWQEYIPSDQQKIPANPLSAYDPHVQDAVMIFRGRYVKSRPQCFEAIRRLITNIVKLGIHSNPETAIIEDIKTNCILPRIRQLRLAGILDASF